VNQYIFDKKRTKCPYCGSSDGFAHVVHPATNTVVGSGIGKCHSCSVFKTQTEAGFVSDTGELVANRGPIEPKYFDVSKLPSHGLLSSNSNLLAFLKYLTGSDIVDDVAQEMFVMGDKWGNTSFVYADIQRRGMSVKTIVYDDNGKRSKDGIKLSGRRIDTSQIAGYVTAEGTMRYVRVSDGAYQFLYNQQSVAGKNDVVVLVESEKTAFIATVFAKMLGIKITFLAAGGSNGVSINKVRALKNVDAVSPELVHRLQNKHVLICYDADDAGVKGSQLAKDALAHLDVQTRIYNMSDIYEEVKLSYPVELRSHSDIADVIVFAMQKGLMLDEVTELLSSIYLRASGKVAIDKVIADRELERINKSDYNKVPPKPSLTFTEASSGKVSQLAIPGNIVMLLASPGVGKSSVISAIVARHIRRTANAFGLDVDAPNGILVIDTEQSKDQVVGLHRRMSRRIECHAEDLPDIFDEAKINWFVTNKKLKVEKQVDNLFAVIEQTSPSFVIVDQVGSLVNNINSIDEVQNLIRRIAVDAESSLRTWIVVLHTNPTSDKGRGVLGSDIHRWASSVLFIKRPANPGDPSLLTTNNADGIMAKVRSGPPVRCFFAWDEERMDFYPTDQTPEVQEDMASVKMAIDEIFTYTGGTSQPIAMSDLRKKLKEMFGSSQGMNIMNYMIQESLLKRTNNGKLWPDYEKLQSR
jgi:hypothetical protein